MANQTFSSPLLADIMFSRWTAVYLVSPTTQVTKTTSLLIFKSKTTLVVTRNLPVLHRHQYEPHRSKTVTSLFAKLTYCCCAPKLPQNSNIFSVQKLRFKYLFSNPSEGSTSKLHRQSSDFKLQLSN